MKTTFTRAWQVIACLQMMIFLCSGQSPGPALFPEESDIGTSVRAGEIEPEAGSRIRRVTVSGGNLRATNDSFRFVWRKWSGGDLTLSANINWPGTVVDPERIASLMIRQSLEPDAAYVAAVIPGNGPACLQCREAAGDAAHRIQADVTAPAGLRFEKHGDYFTMSVAGPDEKFTPAGGSYRVHFREPFYVGLGVCAQAANLPEAAEYSNLELLSPEGDSTRPFRIESTLEVLDVSTLDRSVVFQTREHIESPNWSRDGSSFIFNNADRIWAISRSGGRPRMLDTGTANHCGSNHGISPDGKLLAINDYAAPDHFSRLYILPATGGAPRLVAPVAIGDPAHGLPGAATMPVHPATLPQMHSYWHGWSPDGQTIAFTCVQNGRVDVCTMPTQGGEPTRLTSDSGVNDGPDYTPDGEHIYFSSDRTGLMQIWRMKTDGSEQKQVTDDDCNNWLPHPSPDGQWVAFLSFPKEVKGLPENKDVTLRLLQVSNGRVTVLAKLLGGHGTMDVPSWSPDGRHLAFVSYQRIFR